MSVDQNEFGRIAAQQAGPGEKIQWGVYPKKIYVRYVARLYIDSRKHEQGRFVGVLDVAERDGIACWVLRGVPYCAVGQLAGAIPAAGQRLATGTGGSAGPGG